MARTITFDDLKTQARRRADMESSQLVGDSELEDIVNASIAELHDLLIFSDENYAVEEHTFTTSTDTATYDLPSDHYKLLSVDMNSSSDTNATTGWVGLHPFDISQRNRGVDGQSVDVMYRIMGSQLRLAPTPQANRAVRLWYIPCAQILSSSTETLDGVNGFEEYVVVDAAIKMLQKEESDVSVLLLQKENLRDRIQMMAKNRDVGYPSTIIDRSHWGSVDMWLGADDDD